MIDLTFEYRYVCDECGQTQGLIHDYCPGKFVQERRVVSRWTKSFSPEELYAIMNEWKYGKA